MLKISINDETRNFEDINPSWIHEQIKGRQKEGVPVCVIINIKKPGVDLTVSCGECGGSGDGGGRTPNSQEQKVFILWEELGCKASPINSGNVVAFLNHVKGL